jgi:histone deacetylase 6
MGDAEYLAAFDRVLVPIARSFAPDLVVVSAGFDAASGDPLGGMEVSPAGFAHLTARLTGLAGGRLVLALEGGYNLAAIAASTEACLRVLLGEAPPSLEPGDPTPRTVRILEQVLAAQRPFWPEL